MADPICPKCGSEMEEGFILDKSHGPGRTQAEWIEGKPQRSFWMGLKIAKDKTHAISTFRCQACGYLESYAAAT